MTDSKPTNIVVQAIRLQGATFELNEQFQLSGPINVAFEFDVQRAFPSPRELDVVVTLSVFKDDDAPPFRLTVRYQGKFYVGSDDEAEALRRFARYNAPGMLIPYIRELVTTVSARSSVAALIIPPIDVQRLVENLEERRSEKHADPSHASSGPRFV